jgi:hypothetical protein
MNLLVSLEGEVLGQTLSPENAYRQAMIARTPMLAITSEGELEQLPKAALKDFLDDFSVATPNGLWKKLKSEKFPYWGKVSVQRVLRTLFSDDSAYTREELMEIVPGASWVSITTAMSMLKNKRYSNGRTMVIEQVDGKYRRR